MKVLSLFDGMSAGRYSLEMAGIPVEYYGASEIEKHPISVARHHFPDIDPLGDVCNLKPESFRDVNLILAGSPCQSMSVAGKKNGLTTNDGQIVNSLEKYLFLKNVMEYSYDKNNNYYFNSSVIFWEFIRLYREIKKYNPDVKFFLENVASKQWGKFITDELGIEPIIINSSVVLPHNRLRYYWTNIDYNPIEPTNPTLSTIIPDALAGAGSRGVWNDDDKKYIANLTVRKDGIANCLTAGGGKTCRKYQSQNGEIKDITIEQAEQLQGFPAGYTDVPGVSKYQRFKMLGNGWSVPVISHFFKCLKLEIETKSKHLVLI